VSLLLALQTPPVATGLEENPSYVAPLFLAAAVLLGSVGEDLPASAAALEESSAAAVVVVAAAPVAISDAGEETGLPHPSEESGLAQTIGPLLVAGEPSRSEDFAGSLPLEETISPWTPSATAVWLTVAVDGEEFGLPHPSEETSTDIVIARALPLSSEPRDEEFVAPIPTVVEEDSLFVATEGPAADLIRTSPSEDFAGSLPAEEVADEAAQFVFIAPQIPLTPIVVPEEFGLPHPSEETASDVVLSAWAGGPVPPPPDEEFAGSLPAEEAPDETTAFVAAPPELPWPQATSVEDFAGSLPLEEAGHVLTLTEPIAAPLSFQDEEFGLPHPVEEDGAVLILPVAGTLSLAPPDEEFAGSLPAEEGHEEWSTFAAPIPIGPMTPLWTGEDFAGSLPLEEPPGWWPLPLIRVVLAFGVDEALATPPAPPPAPPPPFAPPPASLVGGGGAWRAMPPCPPDPLCPPDYRREWDQQERDWVCVPCDDVDYALLPLADAMKVKALADGVIETFIDGKTGVVVRLTADDGTVYYYAKVKRVKRGRVKKGDVIGISENTQIAPHMLSPAPRDDDEEEAASAEPPALYGVLPVAPRPIPISPPPALQNGLPPAPSAIAALRPKLSPREVLVLSIGILGVALGIAWFIRTVGTGRRRRPPRRKKAGRRARKLR
jgi:hypothetical protein